MIVIIIIVVAVIFYCLGAMLGKSSLDYKMQNDLISSQKDEIEWWKNQTHEVLKEVNDWKRKYNDMQHKYNAERNKVFEWEENFKVLEQNFEAYIQGRKVPGKTIADRNEQMIKELFNSGLTNEEIAKAVGCGKSTIQRATKKFGLR